jgi:hypothetical protein
MRQNPHPADRLLLLFSSTSPQRQAGGVWQCPDGIALFHFVGDDYGLAFNRDARAGNRARSGTP